MALGARSFFPLGARIPYSQHNAGTGAVFSVECPAMMKPIKGGRALASVKSHRQGPDASLGLDEVRLVADLRIMHAKVDELYQMSKILRSRHDERAVNAYADRDVLAED